MFPLHGRIHLWKIIAQISIIIVALWSTCGRTTIYRHQNYQSGVTRSGPFEAELLIALLTFDFSDIQILNIVNNR